MVTSVRDDDENDYARYWADAAAERQLLAYRRQVDMQNREAIENKLEAAQFEQSMLRKKATEHYESSSYYTAPITSGKQSDEYSN